MKNDWPMGLPPTIATEPMEYGLSKIIAAIHRYPENLRYAARLIAIKCRPKPLKPN